MSPTIEHLKNILREYDIEYQEYTEASGYYIIIKEFIENGPAISIVIEFVNNKNFICIYISNYVLVKDLNKKNLVLQLLNELNGNYTFTKFFMDDKGEIRLATYIPIIANQSPENIILTIQVTSIAAHEEYPIIMKLLWA